MDKKEKDINKDFKDLKKKAESAKKYGHNLQKEGGGLIHEAQQLESILKFVELKNLIREHEIQSWAASANATIPAQPPQNLLQIQSYHLAFGTSASTAALSCNSFSYDSLFHTKQAAKQNKIIDIRLNSDEEKELVEYIKEFNAKHKDVGNLLSMRTGAWQVLNAPVEAKDMLACHSMREILSKVISAGATNEDVMKARWWKFEGKAGGVTLRQRLRYLIFGPIADRQYEDTLETINLEVNKAFDADEKLKKVAHGSKPDKLEVEHAMLVAERTLLNIFRYKKLQEGTE